MTTGKRNVTSQPSVRGAYNWCHCSQEVATRLHWRFDK